MKITKKDIQLLTAFAGILLAVCSYFFIYQKYMEKTEVLVAENLELSSEVKRLEMLQAKRDVYIEETEEMKAFITSFENRFPVNIMTEDSIMTIKNLEDATSVEIPNVAFSGSSEIVYEVQEQADVEGSEDGAPQEGVIVTTEYPDTHLYMSPLGISVECSYDELKSVVRYIYAQQGRMSLEGVQMGYNSSNNELTGNMTINTYYLTGTQKVYEPVAIPSTQLGVETIFGNVE